MPKHERIKKVKCSTANALGKCKRMVLSREQLLTFFVTWEAAKTSYKKSRDQDAKFQIVEDCKIETDRTCTSQFYSSLRQSLKVSTGQTAHSMSSQCPTESYLLFCFRSFLIWETKKPQMRRGQLSLQEGVTFSFFFNKLLWGFFT